MQTLDFYHQPVLLDSCIHYLNVSPVGTYADCTLGGGGHSEAIVQKLSSGILHCFDRDREAIDFASKRLEAYRDRIVFHAVPYGRLFEEVGPGVLDGVLYDLGISSRQIDSSTRGFTFSVEAPLDLRMDVRESFDAQKFLRESSVEEMALAFKRNADLDRSYRLASNLSELCEKKTSPIFPSDIRRIAESIYRGREINGILARIFQAIRMEVNGELAEIETSLNAAVSCLKEKGRLVVLSYHSVEDRCVKNTLAKWEKSCVCPIEQPICTCGGNNQKLVKVIRHPELPSQEEVKKNPRARSAKLRVYERVG